MTIALLVTNVAGERISLRQIRLAALSLPWLCERARQHSLSSDQPEDKQVSSRCMKELMLVVVF
jgi:hypothetical protein